MLTKVQPVHLDQDSDQPDQSPRPPAYDRRACRSRSTAQLQQIAGDRSGSHPGSLPTDHHRPSPTAAHGRLQHPRLYQLTPTVPDRAVGDSSLGSAPNRSHPSITATIRLYPLPDRPRPLPTALQSDSTQHSAFASASESPSARCTRGIDRSLFLRLLRLSTPIDESGRLLLLGPTTASTTRLSRENRHGPRIHEQKNSKISNG